ncbi:MAG: hypothetical protein ACJ790_00920 [Myxococcaceae bacterium]
MQEPAPLPFGRAFTLGLAQAMSLATPTLLLALGRILDAVAGVAISAVALQAIGDRFVLRGFAGVWLTVALIAAVLRAIVAGAAMEQGRARLHGEPKPGVGAAMGVTAGRSLGYVALSALIDLLVRAWFWVALASSGWLFVRALIHHRGGALSSAALALVLTAVVPLSIALSLLTEVAFARSIARGEAYAVAIHGAATSLWRRPWSAFGVLFLFGLLTLIAQVTIAMMVSPLTSTDPFARADSLLLFTGQLTVGVVAAMASAFFDHSKLQALLSLEEQAHRPFWFPPAAPVAIPTAPLLIPVAEVIPVAPLLPPSNPEG